MSEPVRVMRLQSAARAQEPGLLRIEVRSAGGPGESSASHGCAGRILRSVPRGAGATGNRLERAVRVLTTPCVPGKVYWWSSWDVVPSPNPRPRCGAGVGRRASLSAAGNVMLAALWITGSSLLYSNCGKCRIQGARSVNLRARPRGRSASFCLVALARMGCAERSCCTFSRRPQACPGRCVADCRGNVRCRPLRSK